MIDECIMTIYMTPYFERHDTRGDSIGCNHYRLVLGDIHTYNAYVRLNSVNGLYYVMVAVANWRRSRSPCI
jgi:hypothetical protein